MGTFEEQKKYICPRLLDYVLIVGTRTPNRNNSVAQTPELLRRYPLEDHKDFPLAPDVVFFCQPEGCISVGPRRMSLRESTSFVFTLTEKDTGRTRYGICVNFYRPFERRSSRSSTLCQRTGANRTRYSRSSTASEGQPSLDIPQRDSDRPKSPRSKRRQKTASRVRNNTMTSLCIISHHPFFSKFRELLFNLRKLIVACNERSCPSRCGGSKGSMRDSVWSCLTGQANDCQSNLVLHEVREIETWILKLLSAPVPVPGKTLVQLTVLPTELEQPMTFALPDHTRFSLIDFPLHLPLELLGVDTCLSVLTCILLENKLIIQSRDYNTLTMSVLAFTYMLYPLEYMFPVIPLLPTCMSSAEQLLLAPTPYIIGVPSSFLMYKKGFALPDDVWLVDLDTNKITPPSNTQEAGGELPNIPEPEYSALKNHLLQALDASNLWYQSQWFEQNNALASMSMTTQPIKNLDELSQNSELWKKRESLSSQQTGYNPLIKGNDVDSVDVATRVAMVRFFNSPNILAHFTEHTRTLRLYPRPVVAFQFNSFIKSRPKRTLFTTKLAKTQAVEYFAEFVLCPTNVVFQRVQTGLCDPLQIGDKPKWYMSSLKLMDFKVYEETTSTLGAALTAISEQKHSDGHSTDESGSVSDDADSTSSSYSSLSDFVYDIQNSDINGDTPENITEDPQVLMVESTVFNPPRDLQVPEEEIAVSSSDDSDDDDEDISEESSSPKYADEPERPAIDPIQAQRMMDYSSPSDENLFRFDQQSTDAVIRSGQSRPSSTGSTPPAGSGGAGGGSGGATPATRGPDRGLRGSPSSRSSGGASPRLGGSGPGSRTGSLAGSGQSSPMSLRRQTTVPVTGSHASPPQKSPSVVSEFKRKEPPPRPPNSPGLRRNFSLSQQNSPSSTPGGSPNTPGHSPKMPIPSPNPSRPPRSPVPPTPHNAQDARSGSSMASVSSTPSLANSNDRASLRSTASAPVVNKLASAATTLKNVPSPNKAFKSQISTMSLEESATRVASTVETELSNATTKFSEFFGSTKSMPARSTKPFDPLGTRRALVERSGLVNHGMNQVKKSTPKQSHSESKMATTTNSENQTYLKDIINGVHNGQDVGYFKLGRVKKLMEDENYRNFVVSRLNKALDRKLTDEDMHVDDCIVSKQVFKGILTLCKGLIYGLETTYQSQGVGGMSSAFMVLEIMHTHYWETASTSRSDTNPSLASSPFGSRESLSSLATTDTQSKQDAQSDAMVAAIGGVGMQVTGNRAHMQHDAGSPVVVNGDEFENIELRRAMDVNTAASCSGRGGLLSSQHSPRPCHPPPPSTPSSTASTATTHDIPSPHGAESAHLNDQVMREMVRSKAKLLHKHVSSDLSRYESMDSEASDGSTLVSIASDQFDLDTAERRKRLRINHHSIRSTTSDSALLHVSPRHSLSNYQRKQRSLSVLSAKSQVSSGYRYYDGKMLNFNVPQPETNKCYVFEKLTGNQRSWLWDQMQFWEDAFLDAVAQERDIIGLDQGPAEMMDRYSSLGESDRRRLEHDEDRLLCILLYNMIAFMVMVRVSRNEIRRKVRRMLGKCHIGLAYSAEINSLLDNINNLHGNDIDLRPMGSRMMQKQSFSVHWGSDNSGDMLFMEVCDDCIVLRAVTGTIMERWWFEKLMNMTYCPKTKVLCLWRKQGEQSIMHQFYTKKCKDLYCCVREAMEKAAARNNGKVPAQELGGEFPVQDLKTGQGGLLRVCIDGLGMLFSNSKYFIDLSRVRRVVTRKGGIIVIEEYDAKSRKVAHRRYQSKMANEIQYSVLCVFSYVAAVKEQQKRQQQCENAANNNGSNATSNINNTRNNNSTSSSNGSLVTGNANANISLTVTPPTTQTNNNSSKGNRLPRSPVRAL